ncbi:GtrA family protein [Streptococcus dentiloxodontae]
MDKIKAFVSTEVFKYLFFGVLATIVSIVTRLFLFWITQQGDFSAFIANVVSIIFAFFTNDFFVFNQKRAGMMNRFVKFTGARLLTLIMDVLLARLLVDQYPEIIGQFVNHNAGMVNAIETVFSQVLIIVLNYIISKFFVFTGSQRSEK